MAMDFVACLLFGVLEVDKAVILGISTNRMKREILLMFLQYENTRSGSE